MVDWNNLIDCINIYENSCNLIFNSLLSNVKTIIPFEISQFGKNIKFYYKDLKYSSGVTHVDTNINQALHHYLINIKGDYINNLSKNNENNICLGDIGILNNLTYAYIATSKFATNFLNTGTMKYDLLENTLISDRTLLGAINYQYLSKANFIFCNNDWQNISEALRISKIKEYESKIYVDMLKVAPEVVSQMIEQNVLPKTYENLSLNEITDIYKNILEVCYNMSTNYSHQFDVLKFQNNEIKKESICQICYDFQIIKNGDNYDILLDGLVINSDILKTLELKDSKSLDLSDIIKKIKDNNKLFNVNIYELEKFKKK